MCYACICEAVNQLQVLADEHQDGNILLRPEELSKSFWLAQQVRVEKPDRNKTNDIEISWAALMAVYNSSLAGLDISHESSAKAKADLAKLTAEPSEGDTEGGYCWQWKEGTSSAEYKYYAAFLVVSLSNLALKYILMFLVTMFTRVLTVVVRSSGSR